MATKLYVGNLPFSASENGVRDLFAQYGEVHSAKLGCPQRATSCSRVVEPGNMGLYTIPEPETGVWVEFEAGYRRSPPTRFLLPSQGAG